MVWLRTLTRGLTCARVCLRCSVPLRGVRGKAGASTSRSPPLRAPYTARSGGRIRICFASAPENTPAGLNSRNPPTRCLTSVSADSVRIPAPVSSVGSKETVVWGFVCVRSWPAKEPAILRTSASIASRGAESDSAAVLLLGLFYQIQNFHSSVSFCFRSPQLCSGWSR